jgi:hypothetical protein
MIRFDDFRSRLLTLLGTGALVTLGTQCSSSGETNTGVGSGGSGTAGSGTGGLNQAGSQSQGGASGSGGSLGSGGTIGTGGIVGQPCINTEQCITPQSTTSCVFGWDAGAPSSAGAGGEPDGEVACPPLNMVMQCFPMTPPYFNMVTAGPIVQGSNCCYAVQQCTLMGRSFTVGGAARTAPVIGRADWCQEPTTLDASLPSEIRTRLAEAWAADGSIEHASVASFARFTLELLALGAPPDLVMDAQAAAMDEIRHARICFALSRRYSGKAVGPGELDVRDALEAVDFVRFAQRAVEEGCVGETVAALLASEQARGAVDPAIQTALESIAEDEARHAELAWRAVRWALAQGGARVRTAVTQAFDIALARAAELLAVAPSAQDSLREHGRLTSGESAELEARALRDVVAPCARALLAPAEVAESASWAGAAS